jgi:hypothetical protein
MVWIRLYDCPVVPYGLIPTDQLLLLERVAGFPVSGTVAVEKVRLVIVDLQELSIEDLRTKIIAHPPFPIPTVTSAFVIDNSP